MIKHRRSLNGDSTNGRSDISACRLDVSEGFAFDAIMFKRLPSSYSDSCGLRKDAKTDVIFIIVLIFYIVQDKCGYRLNLSNLFVKVKDYWSKHKFSFLIFYRLFNVWSMSLICFVCLQTRSFAVF